jgi:hypothetical protein
MPLQITTTLLEQARAAHRRALLRTPPGAMPIGPIVLRLFDLSVAAASMKSTALV